MTKILIIGGGFGGLSAAQTLGRSKRSDLEITLIDRRNHHLFQPLLYQVATAGLSPADIAAPIRKVLSSYPNIKVLMGEVTAIDPAKQMVSSSAGDLTYDYLIMACGALHSYFGRDHWEEVAPGLKSIEQATEIRRRVLSAFEAAERSSDRAEIKSLLTFVVVGGGPTGVELAGALGEISRYTLSKNFRNIDPSRTRIILIESGDRLLKSFDPELSEVATRKLEELGVTVWTSTRVTELDSEGVWMGEEYLKAETILWAAGIRASELNDCFEDEKDPIGRVNVSQDLSLRSFPHIFVIGDQARCEQDDGVVAPPLAPAAIQQGRHAAKNLLSDLQQKPRTPFSYHDKGMMATIGRSAAVAQKGNLKLTGLLAWLAWCFVHVLYLIGFRNKLLVLIQWAWSYIRFNRGARLITQPNWRMFRSEPRAQVSTQIKPSVPSSDK